MKRKSTCPVCYNEFSDREDYISEMEIELRILRDGQKITNQLLDLYRQYHKLLCDELDEVVGTAYAHGWRSTRYEEGKRLRKKIRKLEGIINASYLDVKRYPKFSTTRTKVDKKRDLRVSKREPKRMHYGLKYGSTKGLIYSQDGYVDKRRTLTKKQKALWLRVYGYIPKWGCFNCGNFDTPVARGMCALGDNGCVWVDWKKKQKELLKSTKNVIEPGAG